MKTFSVQVTGTVESWIDMIEEHHGTEGLERAIRYMFAMGLMTDIQMGDEKVKMLAAVKFRSVKTPEDLISCFQVRAEKTVE